MEEGLAMSSLDRCENNDLQKYTDCEFCGVTLPHCHCKCPYCGERDKCMCACGDAATGG